MRGLWLLKKNKKRSARPMTSRALYGAVPPAFITLCSLRGKRRLLLGKLLSCRGSRATFIPLAIQTRTDRLLSFSAREGITPPVQRHVNVSLCYYYKRIIGECQDIFWDGIKFAQFPSRSPLSCKEDLRRQGARWTTYRAEDRIFWQVPRGVLLRFLRPKVRAKRGRLW